MADQKVAKAGSRAASVGSVATTLRQHGDDGRPVADPGLAPPAYRSFYVWLSDHVVLSLLVTPDGSGRSHLHVVDRLDEETADAIASELLTDGDNGMLEMTFVDMRHAFARLGMFTRAAEGVAGGAA